MTDDPPSSASPPAAEDTGSLVRRATEGDREALDRLATRCESRVLRIVRLRMGKQARRHAESRDVVQDVMLEAVRRVPRLEDRGPRAFARWLRTVAENRIRNLARRKHAAHETLGEPSRGEPEASGPGVLTRVVRGGEDTLLERALRTLPEDDRTVIRLRNFEGLSFREIGDRLDRSEDAASSLHRRAMARLTAQARALQRDPA